jgi:large repetitive protein
MIVPMSRWFLAPFCGLALTVIAVGGNPPPTQLFYVPFPEDNQLAGFSGINSVAVDPLAVFVTFSAATDNTVIYYDHWEDGYEKDITNPVQPTTLVFGDGNPANGYPPGNAADLIPAGTVFSLRNYVTSTSLQAVLDYDARDKVASYKPISLTKTSFPASTNTLMAGCVEVFEQGLWGTEYRVPVGVDMPTTTATSTLTYDADMFGYTALSIMAGAKGATVQIDADNNGVFEQTLTLGEGQTTYVTGVNTGGRVVSDKPVEVVLFCGRPSSNYQSRDTSLLPTYRWSSSYYAPVSTSSTYGTCVFLYNPGASAITVNYDYRSSATAYTTASVSVPAGGNARVNLSPSDASTNFGAYHFYTTGATPSIFYAFCAVDGTSSSTGNNQAYDGGFTLVGQPSLTTQVLVSLGIGRDPYSSTSPTQNGNPVWITTVGNGHTPATIYVDYNGDNAGVLTDPNGNKYDVSYSLRELEQQKIFDPDGDQSGMLVYSLNPAIKIAAAWAQDPNVASTAQPGLDVSTLIPPLREGEGGKKSSLFTDADGDGQVSAGDTLEYDIRGVNSARASIPGPFAVKDNLPSDVTYVAGSTRYRFTIAGSWQAWVNVPDDGSGTAFPLDGAGYSVPGNFGTGQQLQVVFKAVIKNQAQLTGATITNTGSVEISPYGLVLPIEWTDVIYGSIGDRVWNDLNGDGVQDAGENGIAGVDVFADLNNNGVWDSGEPKSTTNASGNYLLSGLTAGTYVVRVDPVDIAAVNVGYGPTYDLDGITTSNVATVTLAGAQDRVDADFGYRVGASVGDRVWMDRDADSVQENGEPGINGVRVYLDLDNDNTYDVGEPNIITSGDGNYYIGNLNPGTYTVRVDTSSLPGGASQTFDLNGGLDHEASVTLIAAEHRGDLDFGYRGTLSIGDLVWEDANADGLSTASVSYNINNGRIDVNGDGAYNTGDDGFIGTMRIIDGYVDIDNDNSAPVDSGDDGTFLGVNIVDGGFDMNNSGSISTTGSNDDGQVTYNAAEAGIANVRVYVDIDNDGLFDATEPSAVTDSNGAYSIGNLFNGTYTVRVASSTLPGSYAQTYDLTSPATDHTATVVLSGSSRTDVDFGYRNDASIGDVIWNDRNADGVQDPGEPGIEGVLVYIDTDGDNVFDQGVERYDITDVDGHYLIENLTAGAYAVRVEFSTLPQGCNQTYDLDATLDHEASRTLTTSENATNVDFGYRASASVGDFVWNDLDADGVQDAGESGISGVRVYLDINGNGVFDSATEPSATTNASGAYSIGNLLPGIYTARVDLSTLPSAYVQTYDIEGALDHRATFSLSANQARTDVDFGYTQQVAIGNLVWNDTDADGQQDAGESGLDGVTVTAFNAANDTIAATTLTAEGGAYEFTLMPGSYYVVFETPSGYTRTLVDQGADASDSDASATAGRTPNVTLTGGQSNFTLDAGFYQTCSIGDFVWNDINANGQQDSGETGLNGVSVTLYRPGYGSDGIAGNADDALAVSSTTTAGGGAYSFSNLRPGTYQVNFGTLAGYNRTPADQGADATDSDADAGTGQTGNIVLAAGASNTTIDAGYYQPATISGHLYIDANGNGAQDSGEPNLANVYVIVTNSLGNPQTVATNSNGDWAAIVPPGSTAANVDETDPDYPAGYSQTEGSDPTLVTAVAGVNTDAGIDGYYQPGGVSGHLYLDSNGDGDQDAGEPNLAGVNVLVTDANGSPQTVSTNSGGNWTAIVPPGSTTANVDETDPDYPAGYSQTEGTDPTNVTAVAGTNTDAGIDGYYKPGAITGTVWVDTDNDSIGDAPLEGVILALVSGSGNPVLDGNGDPVKTVTGSGGTYAFGNLPPGNYGVVETQPAAYASLSDKDGDNPDEIRPITVINGEANSGNDFIEISRCPDTWADWKQLHPAETAAGNPDADAYDNLAEFAFAMPADDGTGSPWLGNTAWIIRPSTIAPGTLEGVFVRPKGAPLNVTYSLQYATTAGNPTVWQSIAITPLIITTADNGDCTETVTIHDLETLTGLTGGTGVVRIKADLDEDPPTGTDHISYSETEGWKETPLELCCRTYNNPFLRETVFTGTISGVSGQDLSFAVSGGAEDLSILLGPGASYYLEVVSGDNEGHRFDIVSASGNTITLANDSSLHAAAAPFNTLTGAPPASLVNDQVVIRRHWALDEVFPPEAFGATGSQSTADQVQVFSGGAWTIYWLYDENDGNPATARWVNAADAGMLDQGSTVIPSGQGLFFNNRTAINSILAYGEIRENDFIRPLAAGNNLIGGGYPVDQSSAGTNGRAMNLAAGFFGSRDFKTADSFFVWNADTTIGAQGYSTYFLLDGAPVQPALIRWVKVGDASILPRDAEILLLGNRGVFVRAKNEIPVYTIPSPWEP